MTSLWVCPVENCTAPAVGDWGGVLRFTEAGQRPIPRYRPRWSPHSRICSLVENLNPSLTQASETHWLRR